LEFPDEIFQGKIEEQWQRYKIF